jgi:hypothetical protein
MKKQKNNKANYIAKGGIFAALSIILIYLSTIITINKLFMLGLASCIIPLSILMTNVKNTFIVYIAVSLLSLFLVPSKGIVITYILIFGLYGFVKYFLERSRNVPIEILLKLLFFNIMILLTYTLYASLFTEVITINLPIYALIAMLQVMFIVYDFTLTVFINYANKNLIKKIK